MRRPGDARIEIPLSAAELEQVRDAAAMQYLSLANYLRSLLGLELREAGGIRAGGFEPGNRHAARKSRRRINDTKRKSRASSVLD